MTDFLLDQIAHIQEVQKAIQNFCNILMKEALEHDTSKFYKKELKTFTETNETMLSTKDGNDINYQKNFNKEGIQHHIKINKHHPEYWDFRNLKMPLDQIIIMFFDWYSRDKLSPNSTFEGFWKYNTSKLKNQPHALAVVELLKEFVFKDHTKSF